MPGTLGYESIFVDPKSGPWNQRERAALLKTEGVAGLSDSVL
jgi:hypothetical protein